MSLLPALIQYTSWSTYVVASLDCMMAIEARTQAGNAQSMPSLTWRAITSCSTQKGNGSIHPTLNLGWYIVCHSVSGPRKQIYLLIQAVCRFWQTKSEAEGKNPAKVTQWLITTFSRIAYRPLNCWIVEQDTCFSFCHFVLESVD